LLQFHGCISGLDVCGLSGRAGAGIKAGKEQAGRAMKSEQEMLLQAVRAMKNAYAPYSGYKAGAVIQTCDGEVYAGCNVENAAYLGYESAETVLGSLLSGSDWAAQGKIPQIDSVLFCVESLDNSLMHMPSGASLGHLRAFGSDTVMLHFATEAEGIKESWALGDLLPNSPKLDYDRQQLERRAAELVELRSAQISQTPDYLETEHQQLNYMRLQAFNIFSKYAVGAAVTSLCGTTFYGCNYETGPHISVHAEGVAIARMISALGPEAKIARVTIMTEGHPGFPCGDCRQKINEFAVAETQITGLSVAGARYSALQSELLPKSFGSFHLKAAEQERAEQSA